MAAKKNTEKKISFNKMDDILKGLTKDNGVRTIPCHLSNGEALDIHVKSVISIEDMGAFVVNLVDNLFAVNDAGEEEYRSYLYRPIFALNILQAYTDVKVDTNTDRLRAILYDTGLYNTIVGMIDVDQLYDLDVAIKEAIEFRKQTILSGEHIKLNYLIEQIDKALPLLEQNAGLLAGMDQEDLTKAIRAMGNMDEGKMVKAMLKEQEGTISHPGSEVYAPLQPGELVVPNNVVEMPKPKKASTRKKKASDVD